VKHKTFFLTIILFFLFFGKENSTAQQQKIGYVNSSKILDDFPEALEAQKKLESLGKQWQDEMDKISKQYQDKGQEYQKKAALLTDDAKKQMQQELLELEQRAYEFRQQKLGPEGELEKERDKLLKPIKDKILKTIEQIAKEQKFQFVFDKNETVQFLLFAEGAYDLTFDVLSKLKRGK